MRVRSARRCSAVVVVCWFVAAGAATAVAEDPVPWQAGFAKAVITPRGPMWLSGYGARDRPAEGAIHDLYARAAALRDPGGRTVVFVATDLIGVPPAMAEFVARAAKEQHGLGRADLMITCSHTHSGPALDDRLSHMLAMGEDDWRAVRAYQAELNDALVELVGRAVENLAPVELAAGSGACGFAVNRRPPIGFGPTDHTVPVLRIRSADGGTLRGVVFGYACHNTTLDGYRWSGDYAGFAALTLEDRHPGAVALFFSGCGADQNPLPRRSVELAEQYGRTLAVAVDEVIVKPLNPVTGGMRTAFRTVDLEFEMVPTRAELEAELAGGNRFRKARAAFLLREIDAHGELSKTYPYPAQVWRLGDQVTWVALGGEVVVDYARRLKQEFGPERTWVAAYANDVVGYIPSERVLTEGGYEGETSMVYYQMPSRWKAGLEDKIIEAVREAVRETARPEAGR